MFPLDLSYFHQEGFQSEEVHKTLNLCSYNSMDSLLNMLVSATDDINEAQSHFSRRRKPLAHLLLIMDGTLIGLV